MKIFLISILALFFSSNILAQDFYYPTKVGTKLEYSIVDKNGKSLGKVMAGPVDAGNESTLAYDYYFFDSNSKPLFRNGEPMLVKVNIDGEKVSLELEGISKANKSKDYLSKGDLMSIPHNPKVGDIVENTNVGVKIGFVKFDIKTFDRKIVGIESVSTKAGTFECVKMEEKTSQEVLGKLEAYDLVSWYTKGLGVVKQMLYDKKDGLVRVFELESVEK